MLEGDGAPFHDAAARARAAGGGRGLARADAPAARSAGGRRARARRRRPLRARRGRLRPAHVPLRPVRLGQDVLARARPGAAPARDRPPHRHPRPQLRLRPPRERARRRRRGARRALRRHGGRRPRPLARRGPLQLAFPELDSATQAAVLRLDPIADREEYGGARRRPRRVEAVGPHRAGGLGRRGGPAPRGPGQEPRRARLGHLVARRGGLDPAGRGRPGRALPRRRPRLAGDARGAGARGRGRARPGSGSAAPTARPC